jgi:hypothetical protein
MTTLERFEHAPAFTALDFLEGERTSLTPRAKNYIFANAKSLAKSYRRQVVGHTTGEFVAAQALDRLHRVLQEGN